MRFVGGESYEVCSIRVKVVMTLDETMKALEAMGTEQNRKVYPRHGIPEPMFGVSLANVASLKKKIKTDHELAKSLWDTGNHDARILALKIADPAKFDRELAEKWLDTTTNYLYPAMIAELTLGKDDWESAMREWAPSTDEWRSCAGFALARLAAERNEKLPDAFFEPILKTICAEIHERPNRTRLAMNAALIAIGQRNKRLGELAVEVAREIGNVNVDHGPTGCKTPDAEASILAGRKG